MTNEQERSEVLEQLRRYLDEVRKNNPARLELGSEAFRQAQYDKTRERIEVVQRLRAWSLGQATLRHIP
jgi:hypothetical protein